MKLTKYIFAIFAALALTACGSDDADNNGGYAPVDINISMGSTRTAPEDLTSTSFTDGDRVALNTDDGQKAVYVYNTGNWTAEGKLLWKSSVIKINAQYPAEGSNGYDRLTADQSTVEKLRNCDIMNYQGTHLEKNGAVDITMSRKTARIMCNIKFGVDYEGKTPVITDCKIGASLTTDTDAQAITPYNNGNTYTVLAAPHAAQKVANLIEMKVDGVRFFIKGVPALEAGKSYNYDIIVGKTKLIVGGVSVEDWTGDVTLDGGIAENKVQVLDLLLSDGTTINKNDADYDTRKKDAVGVVVSTEPSMIGNAAINALKRNGGQPHGLALALKESPEKNINIGLITDNGSTYPGHITSKIYGYNDGYYETWAISLSNTVVSKFVSDFEKSHPVPNTSGWFIPSMGQWIRIIENFANVDLSASYEKNSCSFDDPSKVRDDINAKLKSLKITDYDCITAAACSHESSKTIYYGNYLSSTVKTSVYIYAMILPEANYDKNVINPGLRDLPYSEGFVLRCVIAF